MGGTGWHRSFIIDAALKHIDEWWLVGTYRTVHWGGYPPPPADPENIDITNQYIVEGVKGGLVRLGLFILVISRPQVIKELTEKKVMVEKGIDIESYLSQGGKMRAKLLSPLMYRYQSDTVYSEFPNTLHVDFYDDSVRVESWLTANYGKYYENLNKVYLRDSVMVVNIEGDTLRCPELWWDQNQKRFYTDKPSRIDGKDKHIYCRDGIEGPQDLKVLTCHYPSGPFQVKEGAIPQ